MNARKAVGEGRLNKLRERLLAIAREGGGLPSERELAEFLKVSRLTARKHLQQLCAEQLIEARPGRGYFLTPSATAAMQAPRSNGNVVLFLYTDADGDMVLDPGYVPIVNGASDEARKRGIELYAACQEPSQVRQVVRRRWGSDLRGVLLAWERHDVAEFLIESNIPFVVVEGDIEGLPVTSVIQDNARGVARALEHMASRGHRRIAMVTGGRPGSVHVAQRLAGYREFMLRAGVEGAEDWMVRVDRFQGQEAARRVLAMNPRPTAVFMAHRGMLGEFLAELRRQGVSVPGDLSLAVWGEPETEPSGARSGDITFVAWDRREMGRLAMLALEDRIKSGRTERLVMHIDSRLVDRGSVSTIGG